MTFSFYCAKLRVLRAKMIHCVMTSQLLPLAAWQQASWQPTPTKLNGKRKISFFGYFSEKTMAVWQPAVRNWQRTHLSIRSHWGPVTRTQANKANSDMKYELDQKDIVHFSPGLGMHLNGQLNQIGFTSVCISVFHDLNRLATESNKPNAPTIYVLPRMIQYIRDPTLFYDIPDAQNNRIDLVIQIPPAMQMINQSKFKWKTSLFKLLWNSFPHQVRPEVLISPLCFLFYCRQRRKTIRCGFALRLHWGLLAARPYCSAAFDQSGDSTRTWLHARI